MWEDGGGDPASYPILKKAPLFHALSSEPDMAELLLGDGVRQKITIALLRLMNCFAWQG